VFAAGSSQTTSHDKELARRHQLRRLKKKYGLKVGSTINQRDFVYVILLLLLLGGELLAKRCRTDDLMPSISLLCLPPCRVNPKIL